MNAFQILDKDNNPIPINELDKQAAEFWNVTFDAKWYASPTEMGTNWYDSIGFNIAYPGKFTGGWDGVKIELITTNLQFAALNLIHKKPTATTIVSIIDHYKPYFDLIDHWANQGYQPKQIKSS